MNSSPSPLQVVCAVILSDSGEFLACQRGSQSDLVGKWEFPGGKVDPGETQQCALKREIKEELAVEIEIIEPLTRVSHNYPSLHLELHPYTCRVLNNQTPIALEHAALLWTNPREARALEWADADIAVLDQLIKKSEIF